MATLVALAGLVAAAAQVEVIRADARLVDPLAVLMVRALVPEQIDHGETVRLRIVHDETETDPIRPVPLAMATVLTHRVPRVMAIRVRVATVMVVPRAPAEIDPIRHDRRVTGIHVPHVATATDRTRRVRRVMEIHVPVAMVIAHIHRDQRVMETDHTLRALGVTATVLVARRAPAEIDLIRHVRPVMVTGRIRLVLPAMETAHTLHALLAMVTRAHVVTGIGPAQTDLAVVAHMATAHAVIGNPRVVSVVRSVRR